MKQSGQASISKVVYIPNERESVKLRLCVCVCVWMINIWPKDNKLTG